MVSELLIFAFVLVLLFYWFRYNCHNILRTAATGERARQVASANELRFPSALEYLGSELTAEELEVLDQWIVRDYEVLTSLLAYTAGQRSGSFTFEQHTLMLDFRLQKLWFAITRKYMAGSARRSIEERSHILAHF